MRNLVLFALPALVLVAACRKERTCSCVISESGSKTVHSQTSGSVISIIPGVPIVLTPPTDTTYVLPYSYSTSSDTKHGKVSKNSMRNNCPLTYNESVYDESLDMVPGTHTISTVKSGTKTHTCKIE